MIAPLVQLVADYTYTYTTSSGPVSTPVDGGAVAGLLAFMGIMWLVFLALAVVVLIAMWKLYAKAGRPGWAALIPFYNIWVLNEIGGKPGWWLFLLFIPFVNIVVVFLLALGLARNFGKSTAFGVIALFFFSTIGYLILGFGPATYQAAAAPAQPAAPAMPGTVPPASQA